MELFYRKQGEGRNIIILHGLFGSSDNWITIAKMLADEYTVMDQLIKEIMAKVRIRMISLMKPWPGILWSLLKITIFTTPI